MFWCSSCRKSNCEDGGLEDGSGLVRLRFVYGTVRAVPVFGSDGSSLKKGFVCI